MTPRNTNTGGVLEAMVLPALENMKKKQFDELIGSASQALEHTKGKRDLRTATLHLPPKRMTGHDVRRVRLTMRASQAVFAHFLNVSTKLVQSWEGGRRAPVGPALLLLHIAATQPGVIEAVRQLVQGKAGSRRPQVASLKP